MMIKISLEVSLSLNRSALVNKWKVSTKWVKMSFWNIYTFKMMLLKLCNRNNLTKQKKWAWQNLNTKALLRYSFVPNYRGILVAGLDIFLKNSDWGKRSINSLKWWVVIKKGCALNFVEIQSVYCLYHQNSLDFFN